MNPYHTALCEFTRSIIDWYCGAGDWGFPLIGLRKSDAGKCLRVVIAVADINDCVSGVFRRQAFHLLQRVRDAGCRDKLDLNSFAGGGFALCKTRKTGSTRNDMGERSRWTFLRFLVKGCQTVTGGRTGGK